MPRFDGTGPHGEGRGRGRSNNTQGFSNCTQGRNRGRQGALGFGNNTQTTINLQDISEETELSVLKEQLLVLENTIEKVKNRINELESKNK